MLVAKSGHHLGPIIVLTEKNLTVMQELMEQLADDGRGSERRRQLADLVLGRHGERWRQLADLGIPLVPPHAGRAATGAPRSAWTHRGGPLAESAPMAPRH